MVGGDVSLAAAEVVAGEQGHDICTAKGGVRGARVHVTGWNIFVRGIVRVPKIERRKN